MCCLKVFCIACSSSLLILNTVPFGVLFPLLFLLWCLFFEFLFSSWELNGELKNSSVKNSKGDTTMLLLSEVVITMYQNLICQLRKVSGPV